MYDFDARKMPKVRKAGNGNSEDNDSTNSERGNDCDNGASSKEGGASSDVSVRKQPSTDPAPRSNVIIK